VTRYTDRVESALAGLSPITQALLASLFTWGVTALGAATVFFTSHVNRRLLDLSLGFAAGVMIAASFWSLLAPSIALAREMNMIPWLPAVVGFLLGGSLIRLADAVLPHLHLFKPLREAEGTHTNWGRSALLVIAITLHNIPEGLAIGVSFGAAGLGMANATLGAAVALAIGIGLQNAPEGSAISLPLRGDGMSRLKAWWYGQLSAAVEPVAAVIGAAGVLMMRPILPYALAFAAGAMIYVVIEEVIPESQSGGNADGATIASMVGFVVMMTLDVALG
jgi:ZIP family zinc transporter